MKYECIYCRLVYDSVQSYTYCRGCHSRLSVSLHHNVEVFMEGYTSKPEANNPYTIGSVDYETWDMGQKVKINFINKVN